MKKRFAALLLALALLPAAALGEFATAFTVTAELAETDDTGLLKGVSDLLRVTRVTGTYAENAGSFDLEFKATLNGRADAVIPARLSGVPSHITVTSPLLGEAQLLLNMQAMLEFALKMYNTLGLPAQRLGLMDTWAVEDGLRPAADLWRPLVGPEGGTRTVPKADIAEAAETFADMTYSDRGFSVLMYCVGIETGLDEVLMESFAALPDWVEEHIPEEGLTVTAEGGTVTWTAGEEVLAEMTGGDAPSLTVTLPELIQGGDAVFTLSRSGDTVKVELSLGEGDEQALYVEVTGEHLPEHLASAEPFTVDLSVNGYVLEGLAWIGADPDTGKLAAAELTGEGFNWRLTGDAQGFTLTDVDAESALLTVHTEWADWTPETWPAYLDYQMPGMNFFSINDVTLKELTQQVMKPAVKGLLPVLAEVPASFVAPVLDWAEDVGLIGADSGMVFAAHGGDEDDGEEPFGDEEEEAYGEEDEDVNLPEP